MSIATKDPVFSEFLVDELSDIQNYGIKQVTAYESGAVTYNWGDVLTKSGAKWRQLASADVAAKVTFTAVNSAIYELVVATEQATRTVAVTADGSATAAEIVDAFVTAINADSAINGYVTASNVSNVLTIVEDTPCKLYVSCGANAATALVTITQIPRELAIVVGDKSGLGRGYSTAVSATTDTAFQVLYRGPASFKVGKLGYADSLSSAKQATVQAVLEAQGIKLVSVATQTATNFYA